MNFKKEKMHQLDNIVSKNMDGNFTILSLSENGDFDLVIFSTISKISKKEYILQVSLD